MAHNPSLLLIIAILTINIITISPSSINIDINNSTIKQTHINLYWHNNANATSPNVTDVLSVPPALPNSPVGFGAISVFDDPLTAGPSPGSHLLGRAQGSYVSASHQTFGIMMAMNLVFMGGKFNGSSLAVMGRNEVPLKVRELPVIGGTGVFRLARGYVIMNTYFFDPKAGLAVVEYNIYVWHY